MFFNQIAEAVAKRYPDKILCFYAYVTHTEPPQKVKPHPNLMPVICHTPWEFCHAHPITADCAPCRRFRQAVLRWRELCPHVGIYDYYGHWQWSGQWPLVHTLPVDTVNLSQRCSTLLGEKGWQQVSVNHPFGLLDLRDLFSRDPWVGAYAACWVKLPGPTAISLRVGSNDGAAVWLDGKPILVSDVPRGFQPDQDRVSIAGGGQQWHLLVVKVINHGNLWHLAVRFTDFVGRPLQIPVRATPPQPLGTVQ